MSDEPPVANNEAEHRFEIRLDGRLAELVYHRAGERLLLIHTEVPDALEGHGLGGVLVHAAVEYAQEHGLTIVPRCPFARSWLERHPDVASRVAIDWTPESS